MNCDTEKDQAIEAQTVSVKEFSESSVEDSSFEKGVIRKMDWHICPWIMLCYLLSFLDRINIGNARLYGMEVDLGMRGSQFQIAVSVLFVTYLLFELPSNLIIKKLRPSRYVAFIMFAWGVTATLTGIVQSYKGLIACRLVLGVFESGLLPGMTIYLTFWYTRKELASRVGYLVVCAAFAGAFGGLLASAIGRMDGLAGQRGWRWIFIIQGIPSVILACVVPFVLADHPDTATWLTEEEKEYIRARKFREQGENADMETFHWSDVRKCFKDPKVYAFAAAQFGSNTMIYGYSTFLPTIIQQLGHWSVIQVQLLTVPCYALGAITYLIIAHLSDRYQTRGRFAVSGGIMSIVGYLILLVPSPSGVHYLGCFLVAAGLLVNVGIPISWQPSNIPRYGKRTSATGLQVTVGNAAGIMAPFLYTAQDKPRYIRGHAVSMSMVAFATCIYAALTIVYTKINARRDRGEDDYKMVGKTSEEVGAMGDDSPRFRFIA